MNASRLSQWLLLSPAAVVLRDYQIARGVVGVTPLLGLWPLLLVFIPKCLILISLTSWHKMISLIWPLAHAFTVTEPRTSWSKSLLGSAACQLTVGLNSRSSWRLKIYCHVLMPMTSLFDCFFPSNFSSSPGFVQKAYKTWKILAKKDRYKIALGMQD